MLNKQTRQWSLWVILGATLSLIGPGVGAGESSERAFDLENTSFPKLYNTLSLSNANHAFPLAVLDVNGDEMMDVYIGQGDGRNDFIAIQRPGLPWAVTTLDNNTDTTLGVSVADLNRDFVDDLIVIRSTGVFLYTGIADKGFSAPEKLPDSGHTGTVETRAVVVADVNRDGWLDIYAARGSTDGKGAENRLWVNLAVDSTPKFREAAKGAGVALASDDVAASLTDLNNDGFTDLIVASLSGEPMVFQNNGDGNFTRSPVSLPSLKNVAGLSVDDVDQDGDVDVLVALSQASSSAGGLLLLRNDGDFSLIDVTKDVALTLEHGVDDAVWVDLNNDGHRDLLLTGGRNTKTPQSYVFLQQPNHRFKALSLDSYFDVVPSFLAVSDFNRDGVMDILGVPDRGPIAMRFGKGSKYNWLGVKLRGRDGHAAHGAVVTLRMADGTHFQRRFGLKPNITGLVDQELMFGVGRRGQVSMIEIDWPSGKYTRVDDPELNRHIGFVEPKGKSGSSDALIKHTVLAYVEKTKDGGLRNRRPVDKFVCR